MKKQQVLRSFTTYLPNYTALRPRGLQSYYSLPPEPQTSPSILLLYYLIPLGLPFKVVAV